MLKRSEKTTSARLSLPIPSGLPMSLMKYALTKIPHFTRGFFLGSYHDLALLQEKLPLAWVRDCPPP